MRKHLNEIVLRGPECNIKSLWFILGLDSQLLLCSWKWSGHSVALCANLVLCWLRSLQRLWSTPDKLKRSLNPQSIWVGFVFLMKGLCHSKQWKVQCIRVSSSKISFTFRNFLFLCVDLEGRSDDKIRIMEVVQELQTKRADKQVIFYLPVCRLVFFYKGFLLIMLSRVWGFSNSEATLFRTGKYKLKCLLCCKRFGWVGCDKQWARFS